MRESPRAPVFLLGPPRSGTTLVFELLNRSPELGSLNHESHVLWDTYHWIGDAEWSSHAIPADSITEHERRVLYWAIDRISAGRRYLDKLPRNCLRVPYLSRLFPDARFVFIIRDGRAAVSSTITGWQTPSKFGQGTRLPLHLSIEGYEGLPWKFLVPEGWRSYAVAKKLSEVCAFQWIAANEAVLEARAEIPSERWVEVRYETLVTSPGPTVAALLDALDLSRDARVLSFAEQLDKHVTRTAITPPRTDKWRQEHPDEIEEILPLIRPTMARLGYAAE